MLKAGSVLGHYEISSLLGKGGMGEVYRARDHDLDREVAIKVLPPEVAQDPERLQRFEREAKALAALNHTNVATVHGFSSEGDVVFLTMELVEGPTLADRIAEGPIFVEEAIPVFLQIADGLAAAHERGIVHRDLKPANVKLSPDGVVKILDFGLAKAMPSRAEASDPALSHSPTLTLAATQRGQILGTAAYMSPEQAKGKPVDRRTDVWAFGACLFEALSGKRAFRGNDSSELLASVLMMEPAWDELPESTPWILRRLLQRCLAKEPDRRLHDIADARLELEDALSGDPEVTQAGSGTARPATRAAGRARAALVSLGVPLLTLGLGLLAGLYLVGGPEGAEPGAASVATSLPPTHTVVQLPDSAPLALGTQYPLIGFEPRAVTLSPDGRHLVYVGPAGEGTRLYHRDLTRFEEPVPIAGTEGAQYAFFSPGSSQVGFLTQDRVKKVALDGGAATTLCRARTPILAAWIAGTIYFTENQGRSLAEVPAGGGEPTRLFNTEERLGSAAVVSDVLPGGRSALVSVDSPDSSSSDYSELWVVALDGSDDKPLATTGFDARWLPSGHLIFGRGERLLAAPFDLERRELRGEPVPVLDGVALESIFGNGHVSFSENGTMAFVPGGDLSRGRPAWIDRRGDKGFLEVPERVYGVFDVTADDRRFALQVADVRDYVWIWSREAGGRVLASSASTGWPVWSPDGRALVYWSRPPGSATVHLVTQELRGGTAQTLLSIDNGSPNSWVAPGKVGVSVWGSGGVGVVEVDAPGDILWVERSAAGNVWGAALAPGAGWMAYASEEGPGRFEIWLEDLEGRTRRQVSTDGGVEPAWCRECDELFYRQGNRILSSRVTLEPRLEIGPPLVAFEAPDFVDTKGISFHVSSDGEHLYYVRRSEPPVSDRIHIVHNWFRELERLVPVS